jgi:DNA-directed RNA polymerase subunit L/DNA-directed RNA polymerase alpha subunit
MFHDYAEFGPALLSNPTRKTRATFRLAPSNTTMANTLRRQVLSAVATVGFRTEPAEKSEIQIHTNTTPLVNEMLAHRIGMIPIAADPYTFDVTRYTFRIEKENDTKAMMDVHASDFIVTEHDPTDPLAEERRVPTETFFPPDPITGDTCLITRLRPQWNPIAANERLVLTAKASISTGYENSRWTPSSQCSFENTRDDNAERQEAMFKSWLDTTKKIPDVAALSADRTEDLRREFNTMEVQRCFRVDPATGEPNDFTFHVESVGVLSVPDIFASALRASAEMMTRYQDMDNELPPNVHIQHGDARFPCVDILFQHEGHTLGNLLQHYLVDFHVDGVEEPRIAFAGYKVPHPLKPEMLLRIGLPPDMEDPEAELQTARLVIAKVSRQLRGIFEAMLADWTRFVGPALEDSNAAGNVNANANINNTINNNNA